MTRPDGIRGGQGRDDEDPLRAARGILFALLAAFLIALVVLVVTR